MASEQMQKYMMVKKYKKQFKIAKRVIVMNQQLLSFEKKSHRQPAPLLKKPNLDYEEQSDSESEEYRKKLVDVLFGDGKRGNKTRGNDEDQDIRRFLEEQIPGLYEEEDCYEEESEEEEQKLNYGFNDSIAPQYLTMSKYQKMDYFDNLNAVYMAKMRVTKKDAKKAEIKPERMEKADTKIENEKNTQKTIEKMEKKVVTIAANIQENKMQLQKQQRKEQQIQAIKQERKQQVQSQSLKPQNTTSTVTQVAPYAAASSQCENPVDSQTKKAADACVSNNNINFTSNPTPIQKPRHIRFNEIVCEVIFSKQSEPITIKQSPEQSSFIVFDDDAYEESSESSQEQIQEEDPRLFAGRLMGAKQKYQIGHMVRRNTTVFPQKDDNDRIFFDPEDVSQDSEQQDDLDNILIEQQEDEHLYDVDEDEEHFFNFKSNEFTKQRLQFYRQMEELDKRNQSQSQDEDQEDSQGQEQQQEDSQQISSSQVSNQSQEIKNKEPIQQKQNSNIIENSQVKNNYTQTAKQSNLTTQPQNCSLNNQNLSQKPQVCFKRNIHGKFIDRQSQEPESYLSTLVSKQTNDGSQILTQQKSLQPVQQQQEFSSFINGRKIHPRSFSQPQASQLNQHNQRDNTQDNGLKENKDQSTSAQLIVLESHVLVESTNIPLS